MSHDFSNVQEYAVGTSGRLFVASTKTHDLVVVEGSVYGGPNMLPREEDVLPALAASLLDAGTAHKSKAVIREGLAAKGISLSFGSVGDRTAFSGQCFPEHLATLLSVIVECLGQATFPEAEVRAAKARVLGALAEERTHTRAQAERALAGLVYDPTHVNYIRTTAEEEKAVALVRRSDVQKFRTRLGQGGLVLVVAGDVLVPEARAAAEKAIAKLGEGTISASSKQFNKKALRAGEKLIAVPDKANIETLFGVSVAITSNDERYHALRVVTEMLGGSAFTAHLMRTVRERDGLTYAIYAYLVGFKPDTDGYFKIWANFTPDRFRESVEKTQAEIQYFLKKGMTRAALEETKTRMVGSYAVSLATTQALATALHAIGTNGRPLSYLSEYPDFIRRVSLKDLHGAAALVPFDALSVAAAGTFKKK